CHGAGRNARVALRELGEHLFCRRFGEMSRWLPMDICLVGCFPRPGWCMVHLGSTLSSRGFCFMAQWLPYEHVWVMGYCRLLQPWPGFTPLGNECIEHVVPGFRCIGCVGEE